MSRDDFFQVITDSRNDLILQREKAMFKELEAEYKKAHKELRDITLYYFTKYAGTDGILNSDELFKYKRDQQYKKEISKALIALVAMEKKRFESELNHHFLDEYAYNLFVFDTLSPDKPKLLTLTPKQIEEALKENWAGEVYDATLSRQMKETTDKIYRDLIRLTAGGATLNEVLKELEKRMESALKQAIMVYQNELSRKKTIANDLAMEKSGIPIEGVVWVATLDDRTCSVCHPYDNQFFKRNEIRVVPPLHPRCRCRLVTKIKGHDTTFRRARDPRTQLNYITDKKNFSEWRKEVGL
jgi:SPP1 gp7 family putative phage head morphogenesis protein